MTMTHVQGRAVDVNRRMLSMTGVVGDEGMEESGDGRMLERKRKLTVRRGQSGIV